MVELSVVETLLGVPPDYPSWRVADMAARARILPTWLSSMVAMGRPISPQAADHLARVQRRVAALHQVGDELAAAYDVDVIKGARIAARMPAGLLRNSGDTDVVARNEVALWRCVLDLRERFGAVPQGVNVLRTTESMHLVVAMKWPAEEPELDKPMGADISTCAFSGDMTTVPVRAEPPSDTDICSLFAVAEERFQRRFSRKDMLDMVVLADVLDERFGDTLPALVVHTARELNLAPELAKLLHKTLDWVDLPAVWARIGTELAPAVANEKARRRTDAGDIPKLWFGFPLDDVPSPTLTVRVREFAGTELITTPIGTCLLVDTPNIPAELHAAALEHAALVRRG
jgi:hypothetical protein